MKRYLFILSVFFLFCSFVFSQNNIAGHSIIKMSSAQDSLTKYLETCSSMTKLLTTDGNFLKIEEVEYAKLKKLNNLQFSFIFVTNINNGVKNAALKVERGYGDVCFLDPDEINDLIGVIKYLKDNVIGTQPTSSIMTNYIYTSHDAIIFGVKYKEASQYSTSQSKWVLTYKIGKYGTNISENIKYLDDLYTMFIESQKQINKFLN